MYTFGNESSPIPLSQLDYNFAVVPAYANTAGNVVNSVQANITALGTLTELSVAGNINTGNITTAGGFSVTGNIVSGNIATTGAISAYGTVIGGTVSSVGNIVGVNITALGQVSATGTITGGNLVTAGRISAQGNVLAQGIISATGNVETAQYFIGNFLGNVTGNLGVGGSNTQVLFNNNGNVGAAGGLTYNSGSNTLGILGTVSAQGNIAGGNLRIVGTTQLVGVATAPTAATGTANNQVATTAFVSTTVGTLGTMASQNAAAVAITGGTIGNGIISSATISNSTVTNTAITNTTIDRVTMTGGWTVTPSGSTLYFQFNGANIAKLDSTGNFTTTGDVAAFGNI